MNKKIILSALTATTMATSWGANATLEPRLNGQAYYDTETDLTWTYSTNINGQKTIDDQIGFLSTFTIDSVGDWRIPMHTELVDIVHKSADCSQFTVCFPTGPFDTSWNNFDGLHWVRVTDTTDGQGIHQMHAHGADGFFYNSYNPFWNSVFQSNMEQGEHYFSVWPVHNGDVASISAVPEPATCAMLLAGLGFLSLTGRKYFST